MGGTNRRTCGSLEGRPQLQLLEASQVWPLMHSKSGSVPVAIAPHVPLTPPAFWFAPKQVRHSPSQISSQQTPSVQKSLKQLPFAAQTSPSSLRQTPAPSHETVAPVQGVVALVSS